MRFISSTIMLNSDFLFIMLLAFKHTHLIPDYDVFLCIFLDLLSFCPSIELAHRDHILFTSATFAAELYIYISLIELYISANRLI